MKVPVGQWVLGTHRVSCPGQHLLAMSSCTIGMLGLSSWHQVMAGASLSWDLVLWNSLGMGAACLALFFAAITWMFSSKLLHLRF